MSGENYPFIPSPNFNARQNNWSISILVLHYTVLDFEDTKKTFLDPEKQVSAHYVVDVDGSIYQFVEEENRAWHAGVSFFNGITDVNSNSIGIEIVNAGYDIDNVAEYPAYPYPEVQMNAVAKLSKEIVERYDIPPFCVVGHSDIAPGRKIDPGPHLSWVALHKQGLGMLPNYDLFSNQNLLNAALTNQDNTEISKLLSQYGYDVTNLSATKKAFQMHFNPEAYLCRREFGTYDMGMLKDLLWKKTELEAEVGEVSSEGIEYRLRTSFYCDRDPLDPDIVVGCHTTYHADIVSFSGTQNNVLIPGSVILTGQQVRVERIDSNAFANKRLRRVEFESQFQLTIGNGAFAGNPLQTMVVPSSSQSIRNSLRSGMQGVTTETVLYERGVPTHQWNGNNDWIPIN